MIVAGRSGEIIDGETIDVSSRGMGVKFARGKTPGVDLLLETLVEDRLPVDITLRLPEGSVSAAGNVVWWGMLGDDEKFALRGGVLLLQNWPDADWTLIQKNLES
jgi:hypothetical protein